MSFETLPDGAAWADTCAQRLLASLSTAVTDTGKAIFAGSGGSTPSPIYRRMASADLNWSKVVVTLIDERYVPETSPDSNATLLKRTLLNGPAAAAQNLTTRLGAGVVCAALLALVQAWGGVVLAFYTNWPTSFWITALSVIFYGLSFAPRMRGNAFAG